MRTSMLRRVTGAVALLVALSLTACGGSRGDLEKWVAEVKARPAPPLEPLPTIQQFETFEYTAQDLRDPFDQTFSGEGAGGPRPDPARPKQTLEMFSLDSLKMVGTLGSGKNLVALVMAPDKVTYRVKPGDYMGQSDGRVTGVFEDRIELVELVPDGAGGWLERPAKMALDN
ncbi:pilus assembly protein PilP [Thermomonas alba]|uniref:pilus assembly protein PilP n=1 Tax=Thermomonas alba TaxID=2888525 RepID=UPI001F0492F5|nr:pilus assembly protein PilP [Thermomonas alba]